MIGRTSHRRADGVRRRLLTSWNRGSILALVAGALASLPLPIPAVAAEPASPAGVKSSLDAAKNELDAERPQAARRHLEEAVEGLSALAGLEKPPATLRSLIERARGIRDDLELQGVAVDGIELPSTAARPAAGRDAEAGLAGRPTAGRKDRPSPPAAGAKKGTRPGGRPDPKGESAGVSFVGQVAPLLLRHCGGCHVAGRRGDFQFASFETLMKTGMIQKGAGADSRIVEVIRTGDMPRGGGKVPPEDLARLTRWIDEGATYDGTDPTAPLQGSPAATAPPAMTGPVKLAPGEVSFAFEVAPLLVAQCAGCHDATQPDGNLSMVSLESLLRGGRNGAPVVAGEGAASLLVRKLKGMDIDGQRMPLGKTPLSDEQIATVERWIDEGMKLDLLTAKTALETVAAAGRARSLPHEELRSARFDAADGVWRRAIAEEEPIVVTRGDLRIVGNLGAGRIEEVADEAEKATREVVDALGLRGKPVAKGGVVLLAFDKPYDYSAFWENVLGEDRPKGLTGRSGVAGDVLYGAFVAPSIESPAQRADGLATLAESLAAAAFLARGAPDWFAISAGRAIAVKIAPKSAVGRDLKAAVTQTLQSMRRPQAVVEGNAGPTETALVGGAFLTAVPGGTARLRSVAETLDEGVPFEEAFATVYQGTPEGVFDAWLTREGRRRGAKTER